MQIDLALTDRQLGHLVTTVLYLAENIILEKRLTKTEDEDKSFSNLNP